MATTLLPSILTTDDFPETELQALALDGDVYRLDRAFCSIAEFDEPWRRATALSDLLAVDLRAGQGAAAGRTAAWVWGALGVAPTPHEVYASRPVLSGRGVDVRHIAVPEVDVVDFGPVRVTSPARTALDLARSVRWSADDAAAVRSLVTDHRLDLHDLLADVGRAGRPHSRRARQRLAELR